MHYLNFRLKQFGRAAVRAGIPYILFAILLLSGILFGVLESFSSLSANAHLVVFILINIAHFIYRKDKHFIEDLPKRKIFYYLIDHALISLPYVILLLAFGKLLIASYCLLAMLILAFIFSIIPILENRKSLRLGNLNWKAIPAKYFELRLLLKRSAFFLIILYGLGIGFSSYAAVLPIISVLLITFLLSVFEYFEPKELIFHSQSPQAFLWKCVLKNSWPIHLCLSPLYILYAFQHPSLYLVLLLVIVALQTAICFAVYYKYSMYEPNRKKVYGGAMTAIFLLFLILPGFVIIDIALSIRMYFKAKHNLAKYW